MKENRIDLKYVSFKLCWTNHSFSFQGYFWLKSRALLPLGCEEKSLLLAFSFLVETIPLQLLHIDSWSSFRKYFCWRELLWNFLFPIIMGWVLLVNFKWFLCPSVLGLPTSTTHELTTLASIISISDKYSRT